MRRLLSTQCCFLFFVCSLLSSTAFAQTTDCNGDNIDDATSTARNVVTTNEANVLFGTSILAYDTPDIDADGLDDLVWVARSLAPGSNSDLQYTLHVRKQRANGYFREPTFPATGIVFGTASQFSPPHTIIFEDVDNNNFGDLVLIGETGRAVAYNQGDGNYVVIDVAPGGTTAPTAPNDSVVTTLQGDFDNDGRLDKVEASTNQITVSLQLTANVFTPTFSDQFTSPVQSCGIGGNTPTADIAQGADFDRDGDLDFIVVARLTCTVADTIDYDRISYFDNRGSGNFVRFDIAPPAQFQGRYRFREVMYPVVNGTTNSLSQTLFYNQILTNTGFPASTPRIVSAGFSLVTIGREGVVQDLNLNSVPDECERAIPGDFSGDRRSDNVVARGIGGLWNWFVSSADNLDSTTYGFGLSQFDQLYAGDFNGDGKVEPGVVRDAGFIPGLYGLYWYSLLPNDQVEEVQWGLPGDVPVTGYFDDDNKIDRAVFRNFGGIPYWFIRSTKNGAGNAIQWGLPGDQPFSGDLDGDGVEEIIVARNFLGGIYWFGRGVLPDVTNTATTRLWGLAGDQPLPPEDFDNDGKDDLAVVRVTGRFLTTYINASTAGPVVRTFGLVGDTPYLGFYSGEDRGQLCVFRKATRSAPGLFGSGFEGLHYQLEPDFTIRSAYWGLHGDSIIRTDGKGIAP